MSYTAKPFEPRIQHLLPHLYRRNIAKNVSLSTYFPYKTQYFYGYPAGEDSGFLNKVAPTVEELVAARAYACAGEHVSVIGFAATSTPAISQTLLEEFGIPQLSQAQNNVLPSDISVDVQGRKRNQLIKNALVNSVPPKSLVMAQPFSSRDMSYMYQIPVELTQWLNDKNNMSDYISESLIPKRLAVYDSGKSFVSEASRLPLPFVAKITSSSAGDGVYICLDSTSLAKAMKELKATSGIVIVEAYIETYKNYGIHFGIPSDASQAIDILGVNEQLTTPEGEFIGGIIERRKVPKELKIVREYLLNTVLPTIRKKGWYGVGGFDVLVTEEKRCYFIDCNFRMTGMSAFHFLIANGTVKPPLVSFSGTFKGTQDDLEQQLLPVADISAKAFVQLIALSRHGQQWNFNAALFYKDATELKGRIANILSRGVYSPALEQVAKTL